MATPTTLLPASPAEVKHSGETAEAMAAIKEQTNIIDHSGKRVFSHTIPMSSFVFPSGKTVYFRGGVYSTDVEDEARELDAASKVNPLITEINPETGAALFSPEDKMREQAKKLLD